MKCICGLCMAFENFLGLFLFFLRSLIPKKSSGMQKPYVWLVTPPTKNQHKNSILVHCDSLLFWSSLEHETCQLLEIVTINYFPFSMHFLCHTVMNFCERVGEITFVPYFFQENVLSERENFAAATIIFHFYMYLNDQRVEIYLLNWPNYLTFSFCFIPLLFLRLYLYVSSKRLW